MAKKFTSLAIIFCLLFSFFPNYADAAEIQEITSNTIITNDNLTNVLNYLGYDSSSFIKIDVDGLSFYTVGELESAISIAKSSETATTKVKNIQSSGSYNDINKRAVSPRSSTPHYGSISNMSTTDYGNYQLEFVSSGSYRSSYYVGNTHYPPVWTGVSGCNVFIDSNFLPVIYKIDGKGLIGASYTSSTITMTSEVYVGGYIGIADIGLLQISSVKINTTNYWKISSYMD